MPRPAPVDRDRKLLEFIGAHIADHGYAPTYRQMAAELDVSLKSVRDSLGRLRSAGTVTWLHGSTRTIRLTATETADDAH